jgi:hypothetical protein
VLGESSDRAVSSGGVQEGSLPSQSKGFALGRTRCSVTGSGGADEDIDGSGSEKLGI